jgi:glycerate kinase
LVCGVAEVGRKYDVPVLALCGINALQHKTADDLGVRHIRQLHDASRAIEDTISRAEPLLRQAAAESVRHLRTPPPV